MSHPLTAGTRPTIVGRPVILVVDIFESDFGDREFSHGIPAMPDNRARMEKAAAFVRKGRDLGVPIVVVHEVHRPGGIDFGRELDGSEDVHCVEEPGSPHLPRVGIGMTDDDYVVYKRRYSAFYATDLEILLKGLGASTLILVGGLTDVCIHFTFVDGHQGDYHCRVLEDCVSGSQQAAHDAALASMEYLQTGSVLSSADMLEALQDR
ncbi:Isochorismatase family protein YecD [Nocardioides dokdonensis FR1436]|uniref:Isochorismatase family protein YecD n=1 Tax=Nocardioides dokdonensis FR1436 TaxID=1300347 RepID=A0A1A9GNE2_9ACTN|nr:cysteine hydrolase [Nocardioides dokdonensis]ANH39180.1 Isochorismatase family protein YecD [Nocardioides dokdonensis FR1436]